MKKILCMLLALIMLVSLAGCGGKTEDPQAAEDTLKVVYLVNGNLGDKGFFDSAASGLEMMKNEAPVL